MQQIFEENTILHGGWQMIVQNALLNRIFLYGIYDEIENKSTLCA